MECVVRAFTSLEIRVFEQRVRTGKGKCLDAKFAKFTQSFAKKAQQKVSRCKL